MCGRFALPDDYSEIRIQFDLTSPALNLRPRYNVAPTQTHPIVRPADGGRELVNMRWGLIPVWAKDAKIGYKMISARAETVQTSGAFRNAFKARRCLVPAGAFYEWKKIDSKTKQPYAIGMKDRKVFGFAGLWERWKGPDGPLESYTIITTTPNELCAPIHNRMPVIIAPADYATWLDAATPLDEAAKLLRPYPAEQMTAWPVSTQVNKPANDDAECLEPVAM
jgi:putative SOS response-associated peptidase YedK